VFLSCGSDKKVIIWDINKVGNEIEVVDEDDDEDMIEGKEPVNKNIVNEKESVNKIENDTQTLSSSVSAPLSSKVDDEVIFIHAGHTASVSECCWLYVTEEVDEILEEKKKNFFKKTVEENEENINNEKKIEDKIVEEELINVHNKQKRKRENEEENINEIFPTKRGKIEKNHGDRKYRWIIASVDEEHGSIIVTNR
jgi:hypothetical protein